MNTPNLYFVAAIGIFLTVLFCIAGYYYFQSRADRRQRSWEDLFAKLTWIDRNNIAEVALDLVDESGQPKEVDGCREYGTITDVETDRRPGGIGSAGKK